MNEYFWLVDIIEQINNNEKNDGLEFMGAKNYKFNSIRY